MWILGLKGLTGFGCISKLLYHSLNFVFYFSLILPMAVISVNGLPIYHVKLSVLCLLDAHVAPRLSVFCSQHH